ncbi:hypothetical protein AVEN_241722-1 [Araneus ventricosus]|uniref:Uncharacterized protein n=1 Tax=Araneus ventricosus TaxID=182803 RepID=A0A4Y2QBR0_ARAVE|nr:hypothetical protein AVEN_241722-1 [Araneus ventricosus]
MHDNTRRCIKSNEGYGSQRSRSPQSDYDLEIAEKMKLSINIPITSENRDILILQVNLISVEHRIHYTHRRIESFYFLTMGLSVTENMTAGVRHYPPPHLQ